MRIAAKVRAEKDAHPERFCANKACLWRIVTPAGPRPCQHHPKLQSVAELRQIVREVLTCADCGKLNAREQNGAAMAFEPEPFDPAKHCTCACVAAQ